MNVSSEKVYEARNSPVGLGETIRFTIPPSIQLINTQETYLKMNVVVGEKGFQSPFVAGNQADEAHYLPWSFGEGGASNLIRNLTIRNQETGLIIEQISDYNRLHRCIVNYTENTSEKNLKRLYQGADTLKVAKKNTLTKRNISVAGASTAGESQENIEIEVLIPFTLSGVLNNPQPYPNALCPLEVEILLEEDAYNCLTAQGNELGLEAGNFEDERDSATQVLGYSVDTPYKVNGTPNSGTETSFTLLKVDSGGGHAYTGIVTADNVASFPFFNGQKVTIKGTADIDVTINNIEVSGDSLKLVFASTDFSGNGVANPNVFVKIPTTKPKLVMSELELVVGTLTASPKQMSALESAVNSSNGYGYQFKSYMDFPVNMSAGALQVSNLINCDYRMVKSILSFWENIGDVKNVDRESLIVENDSNIEPLDYQYRFGGLLVPNRSVSLKEYTNAPDEPASWNSVHIKELEQALQCCGWRVKNLSELSECLLVGRGLVPVNSGFTYDMSGNEESRLMLKYTAQSKSLLQHNYVCFMKELRISSKGKMIIE